MSFTSLLHHTVLTFHSQAFTPSRFRFYSHNCWTTQVSDFIHKFALSHPFLRIYFTSLLQHIVFAFHHKSATPLQFHSSSTSSLYHSSFIFYAQVCLITLLSCVIRSVASIRVCHILFTSLLNHSGFIFHTCVSAHDCCKSCTSLLTHSSSICHSQVCWIIQAGILWIHKFAFTHRFHVSFTSLLNCINRL
jgi:hypothetical protein